MTGMSAPDQAVESAEPTVRRSGLLELGLLVALYLGYSLSRLGADGALAPAAERAADLLRVERLLGLDLERRLVGMFVDSSALAVGGSLYYATAHYVVTGVVLLWLYRRRPAYYPRARSVLVVATVVALVLYLLVPMAPPRLVGYPDVLATTADVGWWGADASAPEGLGGWTNELAAFPSMHAGWALWVALTLQVTVASRVVHALAWAHAVATVLVIVGTGNHWLLDAAAGWLLVGLAALRPRLRSRRALARRAPASPSTSATSPAGR